LLKPNLRFHQHVLDDHGATLLSHHEKDSQQSVTQALLQQTPD